MASAFVPTRRRGSREPATDGVLLRRWRQTRDPYDQAALVERFLPLAHHLAGKYRAGEEREDLMQVAAVGLLNAIDRYDPARGVAFTTFAVPTILGELKRYFRDHGWALRVPRDLQELGRRCEALHDELTGKLGRNPTADELADACVTTTERVLEALTATGAHYAKSLNQRAGEPDDVLLVRLNCEDPGFGQVESALALRALLRPLPLLERQVMLLRFEEEMTQREIADIFGISQMQVSRMLARCLGQLALEE